MAGLVRAHRVDKKWHNAENLHLTVCRATSGLHCLSGETYQFFGWQKNGGISHEERATNATRRRRMREVAG